MMKKLPEFIKIIRNMIVAEKKVALPFEIVVDRASHSIQGMSSGKKIYKMTNPKLYFFQSFFFEVQ